MRVGNEQTSKRKKEKGPLEGKQNRFSMCGSTLPFCPCLSSFLFYYIGFWLHYTGALFFSCFFPASPLVTSHTPSHTPPPISHISHHLLLHSAGSQHQPWLLYIRRNQGERVKTKKEGKKIITSSPLAGRLPKNASFSFSSLFFSSSSSSFSFFFSFWRVDSLHL